MAQQTSMSQLVPPGTVIYVAQSTAPTGYIKANGGTVSRSTYSKLFTAIGTMFGAGDGSTTFVLPDLRGEFVRGWDDARGVDMGRALGNSQAQQTDNLRSFLPEYNLPGAPPQTGETTIPQDGSYSAQTGIGGYSGAWCTMKMRLHNRETRPRNVSLLACIKT